MATVKTKINEKALPFDKIVKAAINAVNTTLDAVDKDYQRSFKDFDHKPTMHKERAKVSGNTVTAREWTDDENYVRMNYGTDAHVVAPHIGKVVRFHPDYRRKTRRGRIPSTPGGYGPRVLYRTVKTPWVVSGIEAQRYDLMMAQNNQSVLNKAVQQELAKIK